MLDRISLGGRSWGKGESHGTSESMDGSYGEMTLQRAYVRRRQGSAGRMRVLRVCEANPRA